MSARDPMPTGLFVAQAADLHGKIEFGENCVVHPKATIIAEGGDIIFGEFCIIEEKAKIINRLKKDENGRPIRRDMRIGSYNVFEVHSMVESSDIGDLNEFQVRSIVQDGCKIENFCQVNACMTVPKGTHLPTHSVVYDERGNTRVNTDFNEEAKRVTVRELCIDLMQILAKHNKTKES